MRRAANVYLSASAQKLAFTTSRIDAGTLIHPQAYKAIESGEFRSVVPAAKDNEEADHGDECPPDDQMMSNLSREDQNCAKNRLIFQFNAHMIAANESPDR